MNQNSLDRVVEVSAKMKAALASVVLGQEQVIEEVLIALLAGGHVLIEGAPGLGKTLLVETLAKIVRAKAKRVQFTPDLLPADITGSMVFNPTTGEFSFRKGAVFTQFLLADEINRAPAKTQAALLEVMQERQVSVEGNALPIAAPFMVLATQNPLEHEGTYALPEAQLDRFLLNIEMGFLKAEAEKRLFERVLGQKAPLNSKEMPVEEVVQAEELPSLQQALSLVKVEDRLVEYVLALVRRTREMPVLRVGASPRAGIALLVCARAKAVLAGRDFVLPDDVQALAPSVLRHRLHLTIDAQFDGLTVAQVIAQLLGQVELARQ